MRRDYYPLPMNPVGDISQHLNWSDEYVLTGKRPRARQLALQEIE